METLDLNPSTEGCEQTVSIGHSARVLTVAEKQKLEKDKNLVSDYKQNKYEIEAQKNWDLFYKRNTTKFFKDRHWTKREFSELSCDGERDYHGKTVLEVGCGVGNFIFPLLEEDKSIYFHACDFSPRAVQFVKENPLYDPSRCNAFQCDITADDLTNHIAANSVDMVTMIFVLSAVHPDKMVSALSNILKVLKPGGFLLFRDYGLYDYAMLRFQPGHKLSENFYVRQDGTRAFYFSIELLTQMVTRADFEVVECDYVQRETVNKKEGLNVPRIFVQGKFVKTSMEEKQGKCIPSAGSGCGNSSELDKKINQDGQSLESDLSSHGNEDEISEGATSSGNLGLIRNTENRSLSPRREDKVSDSVVPQTVLPENGS